MDDANKVRQPLIGVINIMPGAEEYFNMFCNELSQVDFKAELLWIGLTSHVSKSTSENTLKRKSCSFFESINKGVDYIVITGAPVEHLDFTEVLYWPELLEILSYCKKYRIPVLGLCWGALAIAKFLGLEKEIYDTKLHGVFETKYIGNGKGILKGSDDIFMCPQSRWAGLSNLAVKKSIQEGTVNPIAMLESSDELVIFETPGSGFVGHLGHPEYNKTRLVQEYLRDRVTEEGTQSNFDANSFDCRWRSHRSNFFNTWLVEVDRSLYGS